MCLGVVYYSIGIKWVIEFVVFCLRNEGLGRYSIRE